MKRRIQPSEWKRRRFRLDIALIAILISVAFILVRGEDSVLYQQAVIALIGAGVALIGQYIFGAVWDDRNYMNAIARQQPHETFTYTEESEEE